MERSNVPSVELEGGSPEAVATIDQGGPAGNTPPVAQHAPILWTVGYEAADSTTSLARCCRQESAGSSTSANSPIAAEKGFASALFCCARERGDRLRTPPRPR